jgi:serine protease Do
MHPKAVYLSRMGSLWRHLLGVGLVAMLLGNPPAQAQAAVIAARPQLSDLVERVWPSVVTIRTRERGASLAQAGAEPGGPADPNLEEFFRRFGIPLPQGRAAPPGEVEPPAQLGIASGFVLSADGYLITNSHVVDGADELTVTLTDQREFIARVVGVDRRTDVAVLKIDAQALTAVKIGDSRRLRVGDWVIAIGSPFGLANSVTAGIVSAKERDTGDFLPLIQTDVAINPGNSGGPLINLDGEVVGINSQIYSRSGGFMGISFAIPIDEAIRVADQLRTSGRVVRGRIGVRITNIDREVALAIGLTHSTGALVQAVEAGGPADRGGVQSGDIITQVDARPVTRSGDLQRLVGAMAPGRDARLEIYRSGRFIELQVAIAEFATDASAESSRRGPQMSVPTPSLALGLQISDLNAEELAQNRLSSGVKVDSSAGMAARAGIREGDILIALANVPLTNARQFDELVAQLDHARPTSVLVRRGSVANFLVVQPWQ